MRTILAMALLAGLAGCESVELHYEQPAAANDFKAAATQASEGYQFVTMPRAYIVVEPQDAASSTPGAGKTSGTGQHEGAAQPGQGTTPTPSTAQKPAAASAMNATRRQALAKAATPKDAASASKPAPAASAAKPADAASNAAAPAAPAADPSLAENTIDGKTWVAKVVMIPDESRTFVVKGVSGFWKSTTLGLTKYQNTDMVSSVSSSAQNLAPKRIGQLAEVVATVGKIAAAVSVSSAPVKVEPLQRFVMAVPESASASAPLRVSLDPKDPQDNDTRFEFFFDADAAPPGTVRYADFHDGTSGKTVGYWPVPACRAATLTVFREADNTKAVFHVTVSSGGVIRLQALPVSGKVDLGSVCSASVSGTTTGDAFGAVSDDLTAVQQGITTAKSAWSPASAASSGAKASGK